MDTATGFLWCNFSRPVYPRNIWELDLSLQLYQFYFLGTFNETGSVSFINPFTPVVPTGTTIFSIFYNL